jgi:radical SAM protein with 4Fe4S-binding SPASM domain
MKFKISALDTQATIIYDNEANIFFDDTGVPLTQTANYIRRRAANWDKTPTWQTSTNIRQIKISLGQFCNYSCTYCMQSQIGEVGKEGFAKNVNTDRIIEILKTNYTVPDNVRIELWGGEPFFYWEDMVKLMEAFDHETAEFQIFTNGSTLRRKHLDFFKGLKSRKIDLGLSHDAAKQETTRGKNYLAENLELLREYREFTNIQPFLSATLTNVNYDLLEINDYFRTMLEAHYGDTNLWINFDVPMIHEKQSLKFSQDQLDGYSANLRKYLQACWEDKNHERMIRGSFFEGGQPSFKRIMESFHSKDIESFIKCAVGSPNSLTIDLEGNVKTCPHAGDAHIFGNMFESQDHIFKNDPTYVRTVEYDQCQKCLVRRFCQGGCPIVIDKNTWFSYHHVLWTHYSTMFQLAMELLLGSKKVMITNVD